MNNQGKPLYVPKALCLLSHQPMFSAFAIFLRFIVIFKFYELVNYIVMLSVLLKIQLVKMQSNMFENHLSIRNYEKVLHVM